MSVIYAKDSQTGQVYQFSDPSLLDNAIKNYHYVPVHQDGTPYVMQNFEGGYLFDGAPLNTYLVGQWYQGQKEALQPYWNNQTVPIPPQAILALPIVPMPAQYTAAAATPMTTWLLYGGLALGAAYALGFFGHGKE
jgi:hypothetical protein